MKVKNEINILREQVRGLSYPDNTILIKEHINGIGFFPCAWGTTDGSNIISSKKIMVLGQDQDNEKGFKKSIDKGHEDYSSTWRNLKAPFKRSEYRFRGLLFHKLHHGNPKKHEKQCWHITSTL